MMYCNTSPLMCCRSSDLVSEPRIRRQTDGVRDDALAGGNGSIGGGMRACIDASIILSLIGMLAGQQLQWRSAG